MLVRKAKHHSSRGLLREVSISKRPLLPHQKLALQYALKRKNPALFLEMRLGKTKIAIEWLKKLNVKKVLIIAPKSVLLAWQEELKMEGIKNFEFIDKQSDLSQKKWWLVNYESVIRRNCGLFHWEAVIVDESTRIKNPKAQITKYLLSNFREARRMILSGLPMPESPLDIVSQALFLDGQFMGFKNYWQFRACMCVTFDKYRWFVRSKILPRFKQYLSTNYLFLDRKSVKLDNRKIYARRYIEPTDKQIKFFKSMLEDFEAEIVKGTTIQTKWAVVQDIWNAQVAGGYFKEQIFSKEKSKELLSLLKGELKNQSVVVWFRFLEELKINYQLLKEAGISCGIIYGGTPQKERAELISKFQKGKLRVLLIQVKTGLFGLNLSKASTAIYYSTDYSLEARKQSEDRLTHPQKKDTLFYIDLVCRKSIDEVILKALRRKHTTAKELITIYTEKLKEWYAKKN